MKEILQKRNNEKGSTLLLIIITMMVLTLLGTTLLTMTLTNIEISHADKRMKKTLYYSESGLEQINAFLGALVEQEIIHAVGETQMDVERKKGVINTYLREISKNVESIRNSENELAKVMQDYNALYPLADFDITNQEHKHLFMDNHIYYLVLMNGNRNSRQYTRYYPTEVAKRTSYNASPFLEEMDLKLTGFLDEYNTIDTFKGITKITDGSVPKIVLLVDDDGMREFAEIKMKDNFKNRFKTSNFTADNHIIKSVVNSKAYKNGNHTKATIEDVLAMIEHTKKEADDDIDSFYMNIEDDASTENEDFSIVIEGIKGNPTKKYTNFDEVSGSEDVFTIHNVRAEYTYNGTTRRSITTDITISPPSDIYYPVDITQDKIVVSDNPLWNAAIVSKQNIRFEKTNAEINGITYSLGEKPNAFGETDTAVKQEKLQSVKYDGIIVTGAGGAGNNFNKAIASTADGSNVVTFNGDVITNSYFQIGHTDNSNVKNTASKDAKVYVNNGHVYCNGLVIQENSVNSLIQMNNTNVYAYDDLELSGDYSHIEVNGSYYGFTDGAEFDEVNHSSAIVINTDVSTTGNSSLKITGEAITGEIAGYNIRPGILIPGTVYVEGIPVDASNKKYWPYQTAESIGLRSEKYANFLAYGEDISAFDDSSNNKIIAQQFTTESSSNLQFVVAETNASGTERYGIEEKKNHLQVLKDNTAYAFEKGATANLDINIDKIIYATGFVAGYEINSSGAKVQTFENFNNPDDPDRGGIDYQTMKQAIYNQYRHAIYYMSHRYNSPADFLAPEASGGVTYEKIEASNVIEDYTNDSIATILKIDDDVYEIGDFSKPKTRTISLISDGTNEAKDYENILILGNNSGFNTSNSFGILGNRHAIGYGPARNTSKYAGYYVITTDGNPKIQDSVLQGIILTTGKIEVIGDIEYKGALIAEQDITFRKGNGVDKTVVSNTDEINSFLAIMVATTPELKVSFLENESDHEYKVDLAEVEVLQKIKLHNANAGSLDNNYDSYLGFKNWRLDE